MLIQTNSLADEALYGLASIVKRFTFRKFDESGRRRPEGYQLLVDNLQQPRVVAAHASANFMIFGLSEALDAAMADLFAGRVEQDPAWKSDPKEWDFGDGRQGIFLNSCSTEVYDAALRAGFTGGEHEEDLHHADSYYFEGAPRFGGLVKHHCRLGVGLELKELLMQGVGYDPDGWYVESCLKNGPSFVVEVEGKPVSWSCTHLNGTMGMIYTPEEHRRKGYARSLSAFQIDHMLGLDGFACCHVVTSNTASQALLKSLGASVVHDNTCWRAVFWPQV